MIAKLCDTFINAVIDTGRSCTKLAWSLSIAASRNGGVHEIGNSEMEEVIKEGNLTIERISPLGLRNGGKSEVRIQGVPV
jgi:hypothetical protein